MIKWQIHDIDQDELTILHAMGQLMNQSLDDTEQNLEAILAFGEIPEEKKTQVMEDKIELGKVRKAFISLMRKIPNLPDEG